MSDPTNTIEMLVDSPILEMVGNEGPILELEGSSDQGNLIEMLSGTSVAALPPPLTFSFPSAAIQWVINHNLGWEPLVDVLSPGGAHVDADVVHQSNFQFHVNFAAPKAGRVVVR